MGLLSWLTSHFSFSHDEIPNDNICADRAGKVRERALMDFENSGAIALVHQAQKRAIHTSWEHANHAAAQAREAADSALQVVEEVARVQRFLDPDGSQSTGISESLLSTFIPLFIISIECHCNL